jgi:taurine dioxygenase
MRIRRLHHDLGAEVRDVDLLHTTTDEIDELRGALDEYELLLFRSGRIPPERHVEITEWFGTPAEDSGEGRRWSVLHNENRAGSMRIPFHSDFTYTDAPIRLISLHAVELPPGGSSTSYVSGTAGWASLPAERQRQLSGLTVRHSYRSRISDDLPDFEADHPLCRLHPRTGRPILFVTEHHAERIVDLDADESDRVLLELFAHLYAPQHVYVHEWRLHDLLVWDNLAVQHARTEEADPALGARALQRVSVNDVTYAELIERARERQRA